MIPAQQDFSLSDLHALLCPMPSTRSHRDRSLPSLHTHFACSEEWSGTRSGTIGDNERERGDRHVDMQNILETMLSILHFIEESQPHLSIVLHCAATVSVIQCAAALAVTWIQIWVWCASIHSLKNRSACLPACLPVCAYVCMYL